MVCFFKAIAHLTSTFYLVCEGNAEYRQRSEVSDMDLTGGGVDIAFQEEPAPDQEFMLFEADDEVRRQKQILKRF